VSAYQHHFSRSISIRSPFSAPCLLWITILFLPRLLLCGTTLTTTLFFIEIAECFTMAPTPETIIGALPPPPGITPNFENPESIAYRVIIVAVIGPLLTIPICALRLYTKRNFLRAVGLDDCGSFILRNSIYPLLIMCRCHRSCDRTLQRLSVYICS